jgi:DNA repair protein SbcC/Rad50
MSLFSRLFGKAPPPSPPTLETRIADLERQPDPVITSIALSRDEVALRTQAVKKLRYGDALLSLALDCGDDAPDTVRHAAQQRLAQLLDAGATDFAQIWERAGNKVQALAVAALSAEPQRLERAVASSSDQDFLQRLVLEGPTARLRQVAAENIHDASRLKQLLKDVRNKDKNVYKIIKRKCDAFQEQQKKQAELQATISSLCESIERHSRKPFDPLFTATLEHLSQQWASLASQAPPDIASRASQAIETARETITRQLQLLAKQAAQAGAIANAGAEQQAVLRDLRQLLASLYTITAEDLPMLQERTGAQLSQCLERWQHTIAYKAPSRLDAAAVEELHAAATQVIQVLLTGGTLQQQLQRLTEPDGGNDPRNDPQQMQQMLALSKLASGVELPAVIEDARRTLDELRQAQQQGQVQQATQLRDLGILIRKANGALNAGRSAQAGRMRRSIELSLRDLPPLPAALTAQLQRLDERLHELRDWQNYAVAPKRADLIQQMEELIGCGEEPTALADLIQKLQAEWKTVSRGSAGQDDEEFQRFHRAAQTAYQPCREYFEAQTKVREENLANRTALLERLRIFESSYDWGDADWKHVARVLREARQEWRSHSPTERAATKPVQDSFDTLLNTIQARLDAQLARNVERKKNLLAQAGKLLEEPDVARALEDLKQLQAAWKAVGLTPHQEDQAMWEEFRRQCDAIHARRQQQYEQQRFELDGNYTKAAALCEQAEALTTLSGAEVFEALKSVARLRDEFAAIDRLPGNSDQLLSTRLQRAGERIEANVERHRQWQEEQRWHALLEAGNLLRLWRLGVVENATDLEAREQAVRSFIDTPRQWPKGALQLLQTELQRSADTDLAANEQALRLLCIRAEILTNVATPLEDQTLRRNHQMQRLVAGAHQATEGEREQLDALLFAWVRVGASPTPVYEALLARLQRCRSGKETQGALAHTA